MRPNNKCRMARPLTLPNFVALEQKSVPDIRFLKFLISPGRELETGSKVHQNSLRPATDKSPSACQISSLSAKRCTRNVIQVFYLLVNFGAPGDPLEVVMYTARPDLSQHEISSRSDNLCTRYQLPNYVAFVDSVTNKHVQ